MKAMLLKAANTPLVLETVPDPVPGPGEAVAKVLACGAGLTIHHARAGRVKVEYPRILGHEIAGEYAEYIKLKAKDFLKFPEGLDWRRNPAEAGVICDAIATPLKVTRKARLAPTDTVAVFGAGGGLGVHMLQVAKWAHARKVIAVDVAAAKFEACVK